jgi:hypothetical protein
MKLAKTPFLLLTFLLEAVEFEKITAQKGKDCIMNASAPMQPVRSWGYYACLPFRFLYQMIMLYQIVDMLTRTISRSPQNAFYHFGVPADLMNAIERRRHEAQFSLRCMVRTWVHANRQRAVAWYKEYCEHTPI